MSLIINILSIVGSLSLFLFGMMLMNKALQKLAGLKLKNLLANITSSKVKSISTGILVTGIIQSSSAITVIIIGLINAGLISLSESIGLILGANIGTTVTAWLIAFGSNESLLGLIALPVIGLVLPFIISKNNKNVAFGEFIIGFALIFIALEFIQHSIPDLNNNPELLSFIKEYSNLKILSVLIFLALGIIITIIFQSSSATIALTFVLYIKGFISLDLAAAMILGENIGTTITVNIAGLVANRQAKRAALLHSIFNVFGVLWFIFLIPFTIKNLQEIISGFTNNKMQIALFSLASFHSIFNILNTIVFVNFIPFFKKSTLRIIPNIENEKSDLLYISRGMFSSSEVSLLQTNKEIVSLAKLAIKMFHQTRDLFSEINDDLFKKTFKDILRTNKKLGKLQLELNEYLTKISEQELSKESSHRVSTMFKTLNEIESIVSIDHKLAKTIKKKKKQKIWFTQSIRDNLNNMFDLMEEVLSEMNNNIAKVTDIDYEKAHFLEKNLNALQKELRKKHIKNIEKKKYTYQAGIIYNDIIMFCEQIGNHVVNISKNLSKKA